MLNQVTATEFTPPGIAQATLLAQVVNTVPFLFEQDWAEIPENGFFSILNAAREAPVRNHFEYFKLCVSAHHSTVASFVPTDVDNLIRHKLWLQANASPETHEKMLDFTLSTLTWDGSRVSTRIVNDPAGGAGLSGLNGEWFSVAVAAYASSRRKNPDAAKTLFEKILEEIERERRIFETHVKNQNGLEALKAATVIAHNLGDLDRVIDLWNLPPDDALRVHAYKAGHKDAAVKAPKLAHIGDLNKAFMADENHRHLPLRKPRALRRRFEFLLPIAPFLDDWGKTVGRELANDPKELGAVVEALVEGWERLPNTVGYPRALAGLENGYRGGLSALCKLVPSRHSKLLSSGKLRQLCSIPQERFEAQWNRFGIKGAGI